MMKPFALCLGLLLLAGCASAPTYFYTLEPRDPETAVQATTHTAVQIAAVNLPKVLDRPQFVMDTGDNQLDVSTQDRWAAPLDEMTAQVLTQDLAKIIPNNQVIPSDAPGPTGKLNIVSVDVSRFMGDYDGTVTLNAYWTISAGDSASGPPAPVTRRTAEIKVHSADDTYNGIAAAMSQALADLAGQIAQALK